MQPLTCSIFFLVSEASPHVIRKTDVVGAYINEPKLRGLQDHLRRVDFELMATIFNLPDEIYKPLKRSCEDYIGSLTSNDPLSYRPHRLPDDRQLMWREIRGYWNPLDIQFLERIIRWIGDSDLLGLLEQHRSLVVESMSPKDDNLLDSDEPDPKVFGSDHTVNTVDSGEGE